MTVAADRILSSLGIEPVVIAGGAADFGTVPISGDYSVAELVDLVKAYDYQLGRENDAINGSSGWSDRAAWTDFVHRWTAFHAGYAPARAAAQAEIDATSDAPNATWTSAQPAYTALAAYFKPVNDFDREFRSHPETHAQAATFPDNPQPRAGTDASIGIIKALAPIDVIGQLNGDLAPHLPGTAGLVKLFAWASAHKKALLVGAVVVVGGVVFTYLSPVIGLAIRGVKGVAAAAAVV